MIRAQRRAHRALFAALALLVPGVLAAALAVRPPRAGGERALAAAAEAPADGVRAWLEAGALRVALGRDWNEPDVLAYACAAAPEDDALPRDARLLGSIAPGARLAWPSGARWLVLYSLAHQRVVGAEQPAEAP